MSTPTQVRHPWRTTLRTALQVGIPVILGVGLVVPQVVDVILAETGDSLPDGARTLLLGIAAAVTMVAAILARVMAIPQVDALLRTWLPGLSTEGRDDTSAGVRRNERGSLDLSAVPFLKHPSEDGCADADRASRLWHGAFCRWYDHRDRGHEFRAAAWGWVADRIVRWA